MSLFSQSFFGEVKKWFRALPMRSISSYDEFETHFLDRWEDKNNPSQILTQYNNLKKGNFDSVQEFIGRFMRFYNSIPTNIKPPIGYC